MAERRRYPDEMLMRSTPLEVAEIITQVGGKLIFGANVERLMLGEVEELWDQVAIAMYPTRAAMFEMIQLPEYAEISVHRTAGLAGPTQY